MRFLLFFILLVISCDKNSSGPNNTTNECIDYTCWNLDNDGVLDNYHDFQFNGSITSAVMNGSQSIANSNDILGAFVNNELRGVAITTEVPFGPYEGTYQFLMLIYSNVSSGESVQFKFYDSQNDTVYNIAQAYNFVSDMILGDVINPIELYIE